MKRKAFYSRLFRLFDNIFYNNKININEYVKNKSKTLVFSSVI